MLEINSDIRGRIATLLKVDVSTLTDGVPLRELLRDSVALVELLVDLEQEFGVTIRQSDLGQTNTIGQLVEMLGRRAGELA